MQIVITIDVGKPEVVEFWKKYNPEAWGMVDNAKLKPNDK